MKLYIPEIGDSIKLTADWTFDLYDEYRNDTLKEVMGITFPEIQSSFQQSAPCTLPAGAVLKIDRIYIRKGVSEYSSVTFLWKGKSTEPRIETYGPGYGRAGSQYKIPRKPVRFWAKLADVNNIEFENVRG